MPQVDWKKPAILVPPLVHGHHDPPAVIRYVQNKEPGLPFPRGDKSSLELGEILAHATAERHGAAAGHAGDKVRIGVGKVAAAVVADHVQTRNRISFGVDGIHVGVDLNAVHRAQNVAGVLSALEGQLVKRRQTERFLAVIYVVAVLAKLVVALDGLDKLFGRQQQLLG